MRSLNMRPVPVAVHAATGVLLVNMLIAAVGGPGWLIGILFLAGPVLVVAMVWSVLKDRTVPMDELAEGQEWGYQDRRDLRPLE
ncbi:MAG: hypothetical protein KF905_03025 [Flavobacteriales bacterium]|nr:hypothetical protein [Flavobacteriales bacterium]